MAESRRASGRPTSGAAWVMLAVVWTVGLGAILASYAAIAGPVLRWGATLVWIAATVAVAGYDRVDSTGKDNVPVDRWTVVHTMTGVVLGLWYLPLAMLVAIVVAWELFEMAVPGFGETEHLVNRAVDVGVAMLGWGAAIVWLRWAAGAPVPLLTSPGSWLAGL